MNEKELVKRMRKDCIPTMFAMCLWGFYSIIDGLFVGRASGDAGLAAINLAWPIPALITAVGAGIGTGGSVLSSTYQGQDKLREADEVEGLTLWMLVGIGILMTIFLWVTHPFLLRLLGAGESTYDLAVTYGRIISVGTCFQMCGAGILPVLRNRKMSFQAMIATASSMVLNICLNYLFMFSMKLGIAGAAMGTVASQAWTILVSLFFLKPEKNRRITVSFQEIKKICQIGFSAMGLSLAPSVVLIFTNYQCLRWGGKEAVACYAVISYVVFPVQAMLTGLGDGSQPLISYLKGKGLVREMECVIQKGGKGEILLGILFFGISYVISPWIPGLFQMSDTSSSYFQWGMLVSSVAFLFMGPVKFHISYLNAMMEVKKTMVLLYGEVLLVSPILILILPMFFGLTGIWLSLGMTQIIMLVIYYFLTKDSSRQHGNIII